MVKPSHSFQHFCKHVLDIYSTEMVLLLQGDLPEFHNSLQAMVLVLRTLVSCEEVVAMSTARHEIWELTNACAPTFECAMHVPHPRHALHDKHVCFHVGCALVEP